ncbi:PIF1-like protein [Mya arenaria]|uniref:ATP-dependent DNA helicase n=1 Tax=Mya arenaria TaxID=6604 RepID=A0ABY7DBS2_MYAAR|nr:PIF1-like protein [Mya arenaria]
MFTLLLLLLPHHSEIDLVGKYGCAKDAFSAKHSLLDFSMDMHNTFLLQVENKMIRLRLAEAELEEQNDILTSGYIDINTHTLSPVANLYTHTYNDFFTETLHFHQTSACSLSEAEFELSCQKLTDCQRNALLAVKKHISDQSCGAVDKYLNYAGLTAFQLRSLQNQFVGVYTIVIDVVSMVSDRMFTFISRRLCEITGNSSPFGGLNIILFGDFFQIKPVCGSFVFHNKVLWELFFPVFLRQNLRQSQDIQYINLLNRDRVGMLNRDDIVLLKSRLDIALSHPSSLCIFPTRSSVREHNQQCLQRLGLNVYKVTAEHYFSTDDSNAGEPCDIVFIPEDDRDAGSLPHHLDISNQSRVMLLRNLDISRGLVNGATGIVQNILLDSLGHVQQINVIFDEPVNNMVAIETMEHKFVYAGRSIVRRSFPLSLCWASTIHTLQGLSTSSCSLDLGSSVFQPGMAYVALSSVTHLTGLHLLRFNPDVVTANETVLEEYNRLHDLAKK